MAKLYVDDVNVGVKELCEVLNIDPKSIPSKLERIFEINPDRITKDEQGNVKTPRRMGVATKFNTFSPLHNKEVTVRYADVALPQTSKSGLNSVNYSPAQLYINGRDESVPDDTEYFYRYINPDCFQSPFRKLDSPFRYQFIDKEAKAKLELIKEEQEIRAMALILGDSAFTITELRQIAKGMNISAVDALTDYEVKNQLKYLAKANPNKFFDDARSNSIIFNGLIQDAIDKQQITLNTSNGYRRWYFLSTELCIVPQGGNELQALKEALTKNMDYLPQIKAAIDGNSVENELDKPENQGFFSQYKKDLDITRNQVSTNFTKENKEVDQLILMEEDVKKFLSELLAESEGGEKINHLRKAKFEKPEYKAAIEAFKAKLLAEQEA